jgi:hypothetical protein
VCVKEKSFVLKKEKGRGNEIKTRDISKCKDNKQMLTVKRNRVIVGKNKAATNMQHNSCGRESRWKTRKTKLGLLLSRVLLHVSDSTDPRNLILPVFH